MLTVRAICPGAGNHGIQLGRRLLLLGKVYSLALEDVEKRLRTLQDLRGQVFRSFLIKITTAFYDDSLRFGKNYEFRRRVMAVVSYEIKSGVGIIRLNNPPVNALSQVLREGIQNAVVAAQGDESQVLLIVCEGRTFVAGADITEFGKPAKAPSLPSILDSLSDNIYLKIQICQIMK